jgi:hypothetical protein
MAEISVGAAVGAGFGLIRRKPLTVLAWGVVPMLITAVIYAVLAPAYFAMLAVALRQGSTAYLNPALTARAAQLQPLVWLINILSVFINAAISCAVFRSILRPEQAGFAYFKLGASELLLGIYLFSLGVAAVIGLLITMIPLGILIGILVAMHAAVVAAIVGIVAGFAIVVAAIYLLLRLSLIGPALVDTGQLGLTEAWAMTQGKAASLLAVALLLFALLLVGYVLVGIVGAIVGIGSLAAVAGGLHQLPALFQNPGGLMGRLAPLLIMFGLLFIPVLGAVQAVVNAPWARAYMDLRPQRDIAETFA